VNLLYLSPGWSTPFAVVTKSAVADITPQHRCHRFGRAGTYGGIQNMPRKHSRVDDVAASARFPALCQLRPARAWNFRRPGCGTRITWPPDPLTRLLMEADGVMETELDAILLRVAAARARG
jgi:hypothetical protein